MSVGHGRRSSSGVAGSGSNLDAPGARPGPGKRTLVEEVQFRGVSRADLTPTGAPAPSSERVHETAAAGVAGPGGSLPHLNSIQAAFGEHDVTGVRAHTDGAARIATSALGAEAYAVGSNVAFGGTPSLHTAAHEAAHVVQQRGGIQLKGGVGVAGDPYEEHADRVADAVVAGQSAQSILAEVPGGGGGGSHAVPRLQLRPATGPDGQGPNTVHDGGATATAAAPKSYADIGAGTVSAFVQYTDKQADWSMSLADEGSRTELRGLMEWLRADDHRVTALNSFRVADVITVKADLAALDAYARGRGTSSVPIDVAPTVAEARALGLDIIKLEGAMQRPVLHQIFTVDAFKQLRTEKKVDAFVHYVNTCAPMLHAKGGVEIFSFLALAAVADPSSFKDVTDIRNYHRFQADALVALRAAQAGNPGNKPFTLVLHSALDHNGAFHQDPELTATITAASNHTIMIEGATSLDAISARLSGLVAVHGREEADPKHAGKKVRRIDQVMVAGHGASQGIELAGSVAADKAGKVKTDSEGDLEIKDDDLNLHVNPKAPETAAHAARTKQFMKQVMRLMSQDPATPHGRIIFNACLTASNDIDPAKVDPKASPEAQAKAMIKAIQASPSLVTAMRQVAAGEGRKVDVRGGNGSFGQVGLIDGKGALDIVADGTDPDGDGSPRTTDPQLTNPDKLVYAEQGTDPQGCMSAVAESWAKDRAKLLPAVQRRRKAPKGGDWSEAVIQAMYELVETRYASSGAGISVLTSVTEGFHELASDTQSRIWPIWDLVADPDWALLEARLGAHGSWTGQPFVPLVFYQAWMFRNPGKTARFLTAVGVMTVRAAKDFLYMDALHQKWATLVPVTSAKPPDPGRLRLALRDLSDESAVQANTKTFLASLVTGGAFVVDVNAPLDGLSDDDTLLRALHLHPSQAAGAGAKADPKAPPPEANVDMDHDAKNESAVQSMSATGKVIAPEVTVREQASSHGKPHPKKLHNGDSVHVMGQTGDWYLIDHEGTRGYTTKRYIQVH